MTERLTLDELKDLLAQYSEAERFELADFCLTGNRAHTGYAWDFLSLDRLPINAVEAKVMHGRNMDFVLFMLKHLGTVRYDMLEAKMARGDYSDPTHPDIDFTFRYNLPDIARIPTAALAGSPEGIGVMREAQALFRWQGFELLPAPDEAPKGGASP